MRKFLFLAVFAVGGCGGGDAPLPIAPTVIRAQCLPCAPPAPAVVMTVYVEKILPCAISISAPVLASLSMETDIFAQSKVLLANIELLMADATAVRAAARACGGQ